jgi:hypothetical protein
MVRCDVGFNVWDDTPEVYGERLRTSAKLRPASHHWSALRLIETRKAVLTTPANAQAMLQGLPVLQQWGAKPLLHGANLCLCRKREFERQRRTAIRLQE